MDTKFNEIIRKGRDKKGSVEDRIGSIENELRSVKNVQNLILDKIANDKK